jgi:hypothetical protein
MADCIVFAVIVWPVGGIWIAITGLGEETLPTMAMTANAAPTASKAGPAWRCHRLAGPLAIRLPPELILRRKVAGAVPDRFEAPLSVGWAKAAVAI